MKTWFAPFVLALVASKNVALLYEILNMPLTKHRNSVGKASVIW